MMVSLKEVGLIVNSNKTSKPVIVFPLFDQVMKILETLTRESKSVMHCGTNELH